MRDVTLRVLRSFWEILTESSSEVLKRTFSVFCTVVLYFGGIVALSHEMTSTASLLRTIDIVWEVLSRYFIVESTRQYCQKWFLFVCPCMCHLNQKFDACSIELIISTKCWYQYLRKHSDNINGSFGQSNITYWPCDWKEDDCRYWTWRRQESATLIICICLRLQEWGINCR